MLSLRSAITLALGLCVCLAPVTLQAQTPPPQPVVVRPNDGPITPPHNFDTWEKEVAAYEAADKQHAPPQNGILFVGSSTIRLWKSLAQDFAGLPVINRGFGGTEIVDATHFADRLILPHKPKLILLRAGTNDIHNGRVPAEVAADFEEFVRTIHNQLPKTEILFIFGNPTPSRWSDNDKIRATNDKIRALAVNMPHVACIDVYDISLTPTGQVRPELFVADRLHFNAEGYKLLAERVRPYLPVPK